MIVAILTSLPFYEHNILIITLHYILNSLFLIELFEQTKFFALDK